MISSHCLFCALQVAMSMDGRLNEGHFIKYLGYLRGTDRGGMAAMYRFLEGLEPSAVGLGGPQEIPQSNEPPQTAAEAREAPDPARLAQADPGAARQKALAAIADTEEFQSSLVDLLQVDDPRWARLALETNTYKLRLMTLKATLVEEGPRVQRCGALPVNPDAPENFSTKRLLRREEKGRNRSKAPHKPPLSAESPENVLPVKLILGDRVPHGIASDDFLLQYIRNFESLYRRGIPV